MADRLGGTDSAKATVGDWIDEVLTRRLTLPEAVRTGQLRKFAGHPPVALRSEGDARFASVLPTMTGPRMPTVQTASGTAHGTVCTGTRICLAD